MRFALLVLLGACSPMVYTKGVPNLSKVDDGIWRSGQITTAEGWQSIQAIAGTRHVYIIKLNFDREGQDTVPDNLASQFTVDYVPIQPEGDQDIWNDTLGTVERPDEMHVEAAELLLAACYIQPKTQMCLVHCTHGQDRTGYIVGRHRVEHEGWTKRRAFEEMLAHHFHWELIGLMAAWAATPP